MKELRIIIVADTSGSCKLKSISQLNRFLEEVGIFFKELAFSYPLIKIVVGGVQFNTKPKYLFEDIWQTVNDEFYFPLLKASGFSHLGKALALLRSLIDKSTDDEGEINQFILYITDGYITDDWANQNKSLATKKSYQSSIKTVYVFNEMYDIDVLSHLTGNFQSIVTKDHFDHLIDMLEKAISNLI